MTRRRLPPKPLARRRAGQRSTGRRADSHPDGLLDLRLNEFYAGAIITGIMAAADRQPDRKWARKWTFDLAAELQAEAMLRRKRKA